MLDQVLFMNSATLLNEIVKECKKREHDTQLHTGWTTDYDVELDTIYIYHNGVEAMNNIDLQRVGIAEFVNEINLKG